MQMKKKLLITFILICFSIVGFAQKFNGGALFGLAATHTTGTLINADSTDFDSPAMFSRVFSKPGLNVGIFTNFYITDNSVLDLEVSFMQKGSRKVPTRADTIAGTVYQSKLSLNYITIPIHYRYIFNDYWSGYVGPNIGFLISSKFTQNYLDFSDLYDFNLIDLSFDIGMGIAIVKDLTLDVKYSGTFFLTPIRSYENNQSWQYGPFSKQFWQKGQCNQVIAFTLRWVIWGKEGKDGLLKFRN